jgi:hypothetical protein
VTNEPYAAALGAFSASAEGSLARTLH